MISNLNCSVYYIKRKDGYHLFLKIRNKAYKTHAEHEAVLALGLIIEPERWGRSGKDSWILGTDADTIQKNMMIRDLITALERTYFREKQRGTEPTALAVAEAYKAEQQRLVRPRRKVLEFINQYVADKKISDITATAYQKSLGGYLASYLQSRYKTDDYYIDSIDVPFLVRFELYLKASNGRRKEGLLKPTTIKYYVERLCTLLSYAREIGEPLQDSVRDYVPSPATKRKRERATNLISTLQETVYWKIPPEDLYKIETTQVLSGAIQGETEKAHGGKAYDLARPRLIFLLQSWTGFAYADICAHKDLRDLIMIDLTGKKSIIYYRAKNGELATLPLFEQTERLMEALAFNAHPQCSYSTFSRKIKSLLTHYNIDQPEDTVTHLGRHVFGSRMLNMGFSMEAISRMMGHTSIAMTEKVYARVDLKKVQSDYDRIQLTSNSLGNRIAI